jgi:methyl-accepting chemotaxis protein
VQAADTIQRVLASVQQVSGIMAEITVASDEQRCGIEQVNQAVSQMDGVTQQNAALVEQAASAAQAMQDQADLLNRTIHRFRLAPGASDARPAPGAQAANAAGFLRIPNRSAA